MDKLNIDFHSLLPYAIDAFTSVYGEEYREIISKKINNAIIVSYHDVDGIKSYIYHLKTCKNREFSLRFLEEIGIDVQKYKNGNYTEPFDSDIRKILNYFIDADSGFSNTSDNDYWSSLRAFDSNNKTDPKQLLKNKLKIINFLRGNEHEQITEETFASFLETEEYNEVLKKITKFNNIYERLLKEYDEWTIQLAPYQKYVEDEQKRKETIFQKKTDEFFKEAFDKLPLFIKDFISHKSIEEQRKVILNTPDLAYKSSIESFGQEQMEKLQSSKVNLSDKIFIISWQSYYFKNLGISIPNETILNYNSEKDIENYLSFLNQEDIKKFIPSDEFVSYISSLKKKKYEEALEEYYTTRKDFIDAMKQFADDPYTRKFIYQHIKNKRICIVSPGITNDKNEFASLMFYTIRDFETGWVFHTFMHESGHVIDQSLKGVGFESINDFMDGARKNPYNHCHRIYEKFNETLNDIFTIEAVKTLQDQNIYLLQSKEFTADASNCNTSSITKNLLLPLIEKFRKQVIKAKIFAEPKELIDYIGEENFEELVDVVNKVESLPTKEIISKIDTHPEDAMVTEYFKQVERAKQIYMNIDNYYANKMTDSIRK